MTSLEQNNPDDQQKQEEQRPVDSNSEQNNVPSKYRNLPSEVVEELWMKPTYLDPEKDQAETERRQKAIEQIKANELSRETEKEKNINDRYAKLLPEQKQQWSEVQKAAQQILIEHIQGQGDVEGLSSEEEYLLAELKTDYSEFKRENPDKPFNSNLEGINLEIYNNLTQKLAFKVLEGRQNIDDQNKANAIREELGIPPQGIKKEELVLPEEKRKPEIQGDKNEAALTKLQQLIEEQAAKSKNPQMLRDLFEKTKQENNKEKIAEMLLGLINTKKRKADYPFNPNYQKAWEQATNDQSLNHKEESGWIYRGNFSTKEKPTITRGSLNITLDENAIRELDTLIQSGAIDANYKFGEPRTGAEASERHDAVTLYFLSEPTPEAMQALSDVAKKYYRGDDLIGHKISEGFYMSEIGSVSDAHAKELAQKLQNINPELARVVDKFLVSDRDQKFKKERYSMSEAQFFSTKEMLNLFDIEINYDQGKGFEILKKSPE